MILQIGSTRWRRTQRQTGCMSKNSQNKLWSAFTGLVLFFGLGMELYPAQDSIPKAYAVKYVSTDAVYLEGGNAAGLMVGQKLVIKKKGAANTVIAQVEIETIAASSAVARILSKEAEITSGDSAYLSEADLEKLKSAETHRYPQVISFTEANPLDEEVRENIPKPPSMEINRIRGRVGFDFGYLQQQGSRATTMTGVTLRIDASRIGGSYWNMQGYYRGYRHSSGGRSSSPTLVDLVNRTYHLSLDYENPNSHWVAGAGRLLVPWASSLDTLDGFYLGRRFEKVTAGIFGGTTPDPTSWNYNPNRQMAGAFVNYEHGSFDSLRFTSTSGFALTRVNWNPERQFGFFQNGLFYKRYLSIYSDMQFDLLNDPANALNSPSSPATSANQSASEHGLKLSRSYLTVRFQPLKQLSFDLSENYFRNIPTFDERLLSTGLLDKYLFQGLSGGFRLELPYKFGIYSTVGRSTRSGDEKPSWDYLVGLAIGKIANTGVRADLRYSRFNSSFGDGTYQSLTLSRELNESLQFDVQIGQQDASSVFTNQNRSRFLNGNLNWFFGKRYYLGMGMALYRGNAENYRQLFVTVGYRFDSRKLKRD
jgi:hypothetical protein